ncbi:hypothetical protein QTL86_13665 [Cellulosilyticum sp. ST5]|uniref:hypothetical protein n=1 Tax=Cellulosilyticum sp. ST5 TaxID=3055805 RepID=UPI00397729A5
MVEILKQAIAKYGPDMQKTIAIEEMAELTKELCKNKRGQDNWDHIAEEIADVEIMLEQLKLIYNIGPLVLAVKEGKIRRLQDRLNNK